MKLPMHHVLFTMWNPVLILVVVLCCKSFSLFFFLVLFIHYTLKCYVIDLVVIRSKRPVANSCLEENVWLLVSGTFSWLEVADCCCLGSSELRLFGLCQRKIEILFFCFYFYLFNPHKKMKMYQRGTWEWTECYFHFGDKQVDTRLFLLMSRVIAGNTHLLILIWHQTNKLLNMGLTCFCLS